MTAAVAVVGLAILIGLALAVGASLNTTAADARWRAVADERRRRDDERRRLDALHRELHEERMRLWREQQALRDLKRRGSLCADCPLRSPLGPPG